MTSETLAFMGALAEVRRAFLKVEIFMQRSGLFAETSMSLTPFSGSTSLQPVTATSLSFDVTGELNNWTNPDKKALGLSLTIVHSNSQWMLEREYGWSGQEGWSVFDSSETSFENAPELIRNLPRLATVFRDSAIEFLSMDFPSLI